jgi:hypothetical protein
MENETLETREDRFRVLAGTRADGNGRGTSTSRLVCPIFSYMSDKYGILSRQLHLNAFNDRIENNQWEMPW